MEELKKETKVSKFSKRLVSNDITENKIRASVIDMLRQKTNENEDFLTVIENQILKETIRDYNNNANFSDTNFLSIYGDNAIYVIQNFDNKSYAYSESAKDVIKNQPNISIAPNDLNKQNWRQYQEKLDKIEQEIMKTKGETTNIYLCSKCKKRNTVYTTMQARSADEGYTVKIVCMTPNCGNTWSENS